MVIIPTADLLKAKVKAVPRKGALQGVERIVARTPPKKSPRKPLFNSTFPNFFPPGSVELKETKEIKCHDKEEKDH